MINLCTNICTRLIERERSQSCVTFIYCIFFLNFLHVLLVYSCSFSFGLVLFCFPSPLLPFLLSPFSDSIFLAERNCRMDIFSVVFNLAISLHFISLPWHMQVWLLFFRPGLVCLTSHGTQHYYIR